MITRIYSDRLLWDGQWLAGYMYVENGTITGFDTVARDADVFHDFSGKYVIPGYIDMHVHGGAGYDFATADREGIEQAIEHHLSHGTTTILPTITSGKLEDMWEALERLAQYMDAKTAPATVAGVHLEGPYFSAAQSGAQDPAVITAPIADDYTRVIEKFGQYIARWSYAPERDANGEFLTALCAAGILPSAGHTDATYAEMVQAADGGCRMVTHLYSCTSTVTRHNCFRRGGVLEAALLRDDVYAELIADGCHLPPELIQLVHKVKGAHRVTLCTDALSVSGTNSAEARVGGVECIVEDGVCKLKDRSAFAGSIATADRLLQVCVKDVGLSLKDAVQMLCENPAQLLGLPKGRLQTGLDADIVALDENLEVCAVVAKGNLYQ